MGEKQKTNDPQTIVTGHLKEGNGGELITFSVRLGFFELVCIVNIPADGETRAPVYCKYKISAPRLDRDNGDNGRQTPSDKTEARD